MEYDVISYWKENNTFQKSIDNRDGQENFVFYDGPPFITGSPHHGSLSTSAIKDAICRYQTMQGKKVERGWGWDCHGLPAEVYTEKKLGIKSKKEIGTTISVSDYVKECREAMVQGSREWDDAIERIGRWVDMSNPYRTMDKDYMESVWWAFKALYEKGSIYEGEKVLLYCPKDATPISKSEVSMDNSYKEITDPSVYVLFKLALGDEDYVLAWTTTPWTLPANTAVAINKDIAYSKVRLDGKNIILATDLIEKILQDDKHQPLSYKIIEDIQADSLIGQYYEPLFTSHGPKAHRIVHADYVSDKDGSGIVHIAPAYGEEDYNLAIKENIAIVHNVDENGYYTSGPWQEQYIWDVNKDIAKAMLAEGKILKIEYIKHEYPHCHRCGNKLMYRAHPSWFYDIQKQKDEMLDSNEHINWIPKHLREGRFKNTISSAPDWNLSRDRYWATPIPVWKGYTIEGTEIIKVVGSYQELQELTGFSSDDYHLPMVMDLTINIDGVELEHCGKVLDCWFESGSMPFAQFHYPFENKEKFEANFPGQFITEYMGQVRAWFYYLHTISIGLFGNECFKNVIAHGTLAGDDGRKMSKSLGNYTEPITLYDKISADAWRFFLMSSPYSVGEDISLKDELIWDVERKLQMLSNSFDFFIMYASVDGWDSDQLNKEPAKNILDKWILSRLNSLIKTHVEYVNSYNLPKALSPMLEFLDDLSNWYIRRSRSRFWKNDNDSDKDQAYNTLYTVLTTFCQLLAPFSPFMSEDIYRKLTAQESVHLTNTPAVNQAWDNPELEADMQNLRSIIKEALSLRSQASIKVRQPLASISVGNISTNLIEILKEEINVKEVKTGHDSISLDLDITPILKKEGLSREIIRLVQAARKNANLNVDDRIHLALHTNDSELLASIDSFADQIKAETLALKLDTKSLYDYQEIQNISDQTVTISLEVSVK